MQFVALAFAAAAALHGSSEPRVAGFFELGAALVEEFEGTQEFRKLRLEFVRTGPGAYSVRTSGDQSPGEDHVVLDRKYAYWVLASGEKWLKVRRSLRVGDRWQHQVRGWDQTYTVEATEIAVTVPAGTFSHCSRVAIDWVAKEHDLEGPQRVVLYLAPGLGVIRREVFSSGEKWHEESLTSVHREVAPN